MVGLRILLPVVLALSGCNAADRTDSRHQVIERTLASSVQLFSHRENGARRAGSGVVIARRDGHSIVLTTAHLLEPQMEQSVVVRTPLDNQEHAATILMVNPERDVALLETPDLGMLPAKIGSDAALGDPVWVVGYPWGRQRTLVDGTVSQVDWDETAYPEPLEGHIRLINAPVTYGSSGGGVFDADNGNLLAIVRAYRTAQLSLPIEGAKPLELPLTGETSVISTTEIVCLLTKEGIRLPGGGDPPDKAC